MSKIFIDTNILTYTVDKQDHTKHKTARKTLKFIIDEHAPVISTQVINEFYVVAVTKMKANPTIVKNIVHNFNNIEIINNDLELIEQAIDISILTQISYWDALIIAAAEKANCKYIVSEDFNGGQNYRGVIALNPFKSSLDF